VAVVAGGATLLAGGAALLAGGAALLLLAPRSAKMRARSSACCVLLAPELAGAAVDACGA
jgi:hypothetical protein